MNRKWHLLTALSLMILWFGYASGIRAQTTANGNPLSVQINQESATMVAGDWIEFSAILRNDSATTTPPLVAHLNIAAVKEGPYVDPEDWAARRTQYLSPLGPGESAQVNWQIHALVKGEFAFFATIVSSDSAFSPVVSPSLLAQVAPDNILPLNAVIPVVAVVPLFPLALLLFGSTRRWRQRGQGVALAPKA
jgi:hypothetical protein